MTLQLTMAGPPGPREARPEDKLHDPATQRARVCERSKQHAEAPREIFWVAGSSPAMVKFGGSR